MNLVVQAILSVLGEAEDPDIVDYYMADKTAPLHYDLEKDEDQCDLENNAIAVNADSEMDIDDLDLELVDGEADLAQTSPLERVCSFHFFHRD